MTHHHDLHQAIITYIKEQLEKEESKLATKFLSFSDKQLVQRMFSNYRNNKGLQLTNFGLEVMKQYFQYYEVKVPQDERILPVHLMYLDTNSKLPYHVGKDKITIYDHVIAMQLRLADGRLSILASN